MNAEDKLVELGLELPPAPRLEVGVLALSLLPEGRGRVPLFNSGEVDLESLRYQVEGPDNVIVVIVYLIFCFP